MEVFSGIHLEFIEHVIAGFLVVGVLLVVGEDRVFAVGGGLIRGDVSVIGLGILAGGEVSGLVDGCHAAEDDHLDDAFSPEISLAIAVSAVGVVGFDR